MHNEHVISDELMHEINLALANGENWMVYNTGLYFLQKEDVYFLKTKQTHMSLRRIISVMLILLKLFILILLQIYCHKCLMEMLWK